MTQLLLTNQKAILFYEKHQHLDFNAMNALFVDVLEKLIDSLSDKIDNSQNTLLIQELTKRMSSIENVVSTQSDAVEQMRGSITSLSSQLHSQVSGIFATHIDSLSNTLREIVKSNNNDSEKNIIRELSVNNELFLNKINSLTDNSEMRNLFSQEVDKLNSAISNGGLSGDKIGDMLTQSRVSLDQSIQEKINSLLSSSNSTNTSMFTELISRLEKTSSTLETVDTYFQKQSGSNTKGKQGEGKLELLLSETFPNASVVNTAGQTAKGDFLLERKDKNKILIDTKDYETVVPIKEVEKIIRDVELNRCHGILISQNSGIAQKDDFEINVHDNNIIVFIHKSLYDPAKIMLAVNIIDHLEPILLKNKENYEESISSDLLMLINREYQELASSKLNLINSIKKTQQELITQVQKLELPTLTKYLETKYANTGKAAFKCDNCCTFYGKNSKSLAAHQRKCKKNVVIASIEEPTENVVINIEPHQMTIETAFSQN
jgi:hypothetical protein